MKSKIRELLPEIAWIKSPELQEKVVACYVDALNEKGFCLEGTSVDSGYPEAFVLEGHPFYAAVIYHPEFKSRLGKPHPLFNALIQAGMEGK